MRTTAVVGDAFVRVRTFSAGLSGDIADQVRRQLRGADRQIDREGQRTGDRLGESIGRGLRNNRGIGTSALRMAKNFGDAFNLGIGRARMGRGIISILMAIGPSVTAAGAAIGTALASEILVAISAIGPGLIGLGGVLSAAGATALLNFGLLAAAIEAGGESVAALKEQLSSLVKLIGKPIADNMVAGMAEGIQILIDAVPQLNGVLEITGQKFGEIAKSIAETLASSENMGRIQSILQTNNEFLERFKGGFSDLITSFLILLDAMRPFIGYLGQGLEKFGSWLKTLLEAKEASGELNEIVTRYLERWKQLWATIKDFAAGLSNLFKAIGPVGEQLANSMANVAAKFREWTGDQANQERITAFFQKAHDLSSKIFEVLGKLFAAGGNAFLEADFTNLFAVLDSIANVLGPAIADIFNQIQEGMGPHLVVIVENLGVAFQKMADSGMIEKIANAVGTLLEKVSALLATDLGSWVLGLGLAWALFGGIISPIVGLLTSLAASVTFAGLAIGAAVGFFALMWQNSESLRNAIGELVTVVGGKFTEIWDELSPKLSTLWSELQRLAGVIGDRLAPVIEWLTPIFRRFMDVIGSVLDFVVTHLTEVIGFLADLFSGDFAGAWEHAKNIVSNFVTGAISILDNLRLMIAQIFTGIWDWLWARAEDGWNWLVGIFQGGYDAVTGGITAFGNNIQTWWNQFWTWVGQMAVAGWEWIKGVFVGAYEAVTGGIISFGNTIQGWWNTFWTWVGQAAVAGWEWIKGVFVGAYNAVTSGITSFGNTIQGWWNGFWSWVGNAAVAGWEWIKGVFVGAYNAVTGGIRNFGNTIQGIWNSIWSSVGDFLRNTWENIKSWVSNAVGNVISAVSGGFNGLVGTVQRIWNSIYDAIVQPIIDAYNAVTGWIGDIKDAIGEALGWIGEKVGEANAKLEDILATQAEAGTVTANMFNPDALPGTYMAEGGIVPAIPGGWPVIVGEAGRSERIEPLDSSGLSRRDRAMISRIVAEMTATTSQDGSTTVKVFLDSRELSGIVQNVVTARQHALARDVSRRRKVFA